MATESWYAWLALRRRVSMSAIGSVIVMVMCSFSSWFPRPGTRTFDVVMWWLPARLGHAGELAAVGHLPQADPAQAELAVDGLGTAAALAAGVAAHRELRLARGLDPQSGLRHVSCPP